MSADESIAQTNLPTIWPWFAGWVAAIGASLFLALRVEADRMIIGYAVGSMIFAFAIAVLLAWIAWRIGKRRNAVAHAAFWIVFGLVAAERLAGLHVRVSQTRMYLAMQQLEQSLSAEIEERMLRVQAVDAKLRAVDVRSGGDAARAKLKHRIELTALLHSGLESMLEFYKEFTPRVNAELEKAGVPAEAAQMMAVIPEAASIMETIELRMKFSDVVAEQLALLDSTWGQWSGEEDGEIIFGPNAPTDAQARFDDLAKRQRALSIEVQKRALSLMRRNVGNSGPQPRSDHAPGSNH